MMISTKGRYALRVLTDLAEHKDEGPIPLKIIAARQEISQKYLESIMTSLSKGGFVEASHGKGGGYSLNAPACDYKIGDILRFTEGTLAPVECLEKGKSDCPNAGCCRTLPMWEKLDSMINNFFDSISLEQLMSSGSKK